MEITPGMRVGSFEVLAPLGAGGMGTVYRARDPKLDREVAIKILQEKLVGSREYLRRFEREARSASALNHPNIVTVFEIDEFEGSPFIAMELVEGTRLRDLVKRGPLPIRKLLQIATQIADGLAAAHDQGIVHRDIKPENIMITSQGLVKILDFGLARVIREAGEEEVTSELITERRDGHVIGTTAYMSPEQASGAPIDYRSDQFSFGSMLYEMATGRRAFRRETTVETLDAIIHDEPEAMERINPNIPAPLRWIIERCLAKDRNDRYASTRDLARELQTVRDRLSETGSGDRRAPAMPARRRALLAAVVVAVLAALGTFVGTFRRLQTRSQTLPNQKFVAVLPFKDLSGRPDGQLFSQGFGEAVSARLSKFAGIQVIPPASSATLVARGADVRRVAQELGATLIVNASVQRTGDSLRVSYSVLDSTRNVSVAGDTVNGSVQDIWNVQDHVADAIATDLGIEHRRPPTRNAGLESPEEQDLYVRALGSLQRYEDEKSVDTAINLLRELLETAPDSALVHAALGRAYLAKYYLTRDRDWSAKAIRACSRAQQLEPSSADVLLTLGDVERVTGQYEQAIATFKSALASLPDSPEAAIGLGKSYQLHGQPAEAEQAFRRGIARRPTWWSGYNSLGILYLTRGRYDEAASEFREVIRLNPESPWGYTNSGSVYLFKGKLQQAAAAFTKAISLREDADAYSNLGYCHYFLGDFDKSAASYRKATQLRPGIAVHWANLGDACSWTPHCRNEAPDAYKKAIELLRRDLMVNSKQSAGHATLAICLAKTAAQSEAKQEIKRALELDPGNSTRMYQAARVADMTGDRDLAVTWLQRALAAGYQRFEIDRDPEFAKLRTTDAFRQMLTKRAQTS